MVEFRKKTTITNDTIVSQYLNDMYDGGTVTADIHGGRKQSKYLFKATIPPTPNYGAAELERLDLDLYINSISIGETANFPELTTYLMQNPVDITEGYMKRKDEELMVYSGSYGGSLSLDLRLDGTGTSGGDGTIFKNVNRTLLLDNREQLFTTVSLAVAEGESHYSFWTGRRNGRDAATIRNDFGMSAEEAGIPNVFGTSKREYIKIDNDVSSTTVTFASGHIDNPIDGAV